MQKHEEKFLKRMNKRDLVMHVQGLYEIIRIQYNIIKEPWDKKYALTSEFGCAVPVVFHTSEGIKTILPGKRYDDNLNEIED